MLVLFDHYRYRSGNMIDIEVWCRSDAGNHQLKANKDVHNSIAYSALKARDARPDDGLERTILSFKNLPHCVLMNLCGKK